MPGAPLGTTGAPGDGRAGGWGSDRPGTISPMELGSRMGKSSPGIPSFLLILQFLESSPLSLEQGKMTSGFP